MEGINQGRFLLEIDGIPSIRATDCTPPSKDHTITELWESNKPNPNLVRGNFKISDFTMKHAFGINNASGGCLQWLADVCSGQSVERRNARLIVMTEDGLTPEKIYDMERCMPVMFKPETFTAGGSDAAFFSFSLRPEDYTEG